MEDLRAFFTEVGRFFLPVAGLGAKEKSLTRCTVGELAFCVSSTTGRPCLVVPTRAEIYPLRANNICFEKVGCM